MRRLVRSKYQIDLAECQSAPWTNRSSDSIILRCQLSPDAIEIADLHLFQLSNFSDVLIRKETQSVEQAPQCCRSCSPSLEWDFDCRCASQCPDPVLNRDQSVSEPCWEKHWWPIPVVSRQLTFVLARWFDTAWRMTKPINDDHSDVRDCSTLLGGDRPIDLEYKKQISRQEIENEHSVI